MVFHGLSRLLVMGDMRGIRRFICADLGGISEVGKDLSPRLQSAFPGVDAEDVWLPTPSAAGLFRNVPHLYAGVSGSEKDFLFFIDWHYRVNVLCAAKRP